MADYIKRDDAIEVYSELYWMHEGLLNFEEELGKVYDEILGIPPADAAPVRHGRWVYKDEPIFGNPYGRYCCNLCEHGIADKENYCPNCGAKMDEGEDDE